MAAKKETTHLIRLAEDLSLPETTFTIRSWPMSHIACWNWRLTRIYFTTLDA